MTNPIEKEQTGLEFGGEEISMADRVAAQEIVENIRKNNPSIFERFRNVKNLLALMIVLKGALVASEAVAAPMGAENKKEIKGKVPITTESRKIESTSGGDKPILGQPLDADALEALFGPVPNDIAKAVKAGAKMTFSGDTEKGVKIYNEKGEHIYDYKMIFDEQGTPHPALKAVESAKAEVNKYSPGNYSTHIEGKVKMPSSLDFLGGHQKLIDSKNFNDGKDIGKAQAPEKISQIQQDKYWKLQMPKIIDTLKAKVKAGAIAYDGTKLSPDDKNLLAEELGRTVGVINAYEDVLKNTPDK